MLELPSQRLVSGKRDAGLDDCYGRQGGICSAFTSVCYPPVWARKSPFRLPPVEDNPSGWLEFKWPEAIRVLSGRQSAKRSSARC